MESEKAVEAAKALNDQEKLLAELEEQERKEAIEHRDVLLALQEILSTKSGRKVFQYLFKCFEVGNQAEQGLDPNFMYDRIGFLRAGSSIFELVAQANPAVAGELLANVKKEHYDEIYAKANIGASRGK